MSDDTDPTKFGPGMWISIHTLALRANTQEKKKEYVEEVISLVESIKCGECHGHATEYLKKNPIEKYFNVKDVKSGAEIGCFKWSWVFHNAVNKRLGKKELDFNTALMKYIPSKEKCTNCGSGHHEKSKVKEEKHSIKIKPKVLR